MKGTYLWNTGNALSDIRLIIEGAVTLFEEDASNLHKIAMDSKELIAAAAFDTIGTALYDLRTRIRKMQEEHTIEVVRHYKED